ncbi:MAG: hypothetical protein AVDCRST_MAG79-1136, partial [uncultured Thermoleophilia bacterium]
SRLVRAARRPSRCTPARRLPCRVAGRTGSSTTGPSRPSRSRSSTGRPPRRASGSSTTSTGRSVASACTRHRRPPGRGATEPSGSPSTWPRASAAAGRPSPVP